MTTITLNNEQLHLIGRPLSVNDTARRFTLADNELKLRKLEEFKGRIKLITTFPSLDTPVCDLQVKEFNQRAQELSKEVEILAVSKDLPFAQKRFCQLNVIDKLTLLSDYRDSSFGFNYGLQIKELGLLARSVMIIDKDDIVRYLQIVPKLTDAPDYAAALDALEDVVHNPSGISEMPSSGCKPCEAGSGALGRERIAVLLAGRRGWELVEDKKLSKEFKFKDFRQAKGSMDILAAVAEEQGHHPDFTLRYGRLKVVLTTHAAGGLTENDFIMAKIIDEVDL